MIKKSPRAGRVPTFVLYVFILGTVCFQARAESVPSRFASPPAVSGKGEAITVTFAVNEATDVEVSILNAQGKVVRHLAAGVLGRKTPPPAPLKSGLNQSLVWNGKDDYGEAAKGGPFQVRVRAGMGVKLDRIVGGDPYAYLSDDMDQHNHAVWKMTGLEQKPDGTVYVLGNSTFIGPPALRAYDADGNYLRTVFPPPAGRPVEKMNGWGIYPHQDGTYTPVFANTNSPGISQTLMVGDRMAGGLPSLLASPDKDHLLVYKETRVMKIGVDGACAKKELRALVLEPAMQDGKAKKGPGIIMAGPVFNAVSADGKTMYLSGMFKGFNQSGNIRSIKPDGFWRDGTVWKLDLATGKASLFYRMESDVITDLAKRQASPIGSKLGSYAAFHGVAVDREQRVFLCDRQHERVLVLGPDGKVQRKLPVKYPDALTLSPDQKSLYVTIRANKDHFKGKIEESSRGARYSPGGKIGLVKFSDWRKDDKPTASVDIAGVGHEYSTGGRSFVLATKSTDGTRVNVWVAYHSIPVCIYKDLGDRFEMRKNFLQASGQICLDLQRIAVDSETDAVYIPDGYGSLFSVTDWEGKGKGKGPQFVRCRLKDKTPIKASSVAIDSRRRMLYSRSQGRGLGWAGPVKRYRLDEAKDHLVPAEVGKTGSNDLTGDTIQVPWHITWGCGDRGLAIGPDGNLATLDPSPSKEEKNVYAVGQLRIFKRDETKVPWSPMDVKLMGRLGAIRYDHQGNLYVGRQERSKNIPKMFGKYKLFQRIMGVIVKFSPTGSLAEGDLYPTAPKAPARTYEVNLGAYGNKWFRTPRFGVDGWGRIYYPTSIAQRVGVIDNAGQEVLSFGTWGNRDSMGGLPGDLVPTKDIPMAYPNAVDATDDYIYVGDMANCRLLRIAKTFASAATVPIR